MKNNNEKQGSQKAVFDLGGKKPKNPNTDKVKNNKGGGKNS